MCICWLNNKNVKTDTRLVEISRGESGQAINTENFVCKMHKHLPLMRRTTDMTKDWWVAASKDWRNLFNWLNLSSICPSFFLSQLLRHPPGGCSSRPPTTSVSSSRTQRSLTDSPCFRTPNSLPVRLRPVAGRHSLFLGLNFYFAPHPNHHLEWTPVLTSKTSPPGDIRRPSISPQALFVSRP